MRFYEGYIDFYVLKECSYFYFEEPVQCLVTAGLGTSNNLYMFVLSQRSLLFQNEFTVFSLAAGDRWGGGSAMESGGCSQRGCPFTSTPFQFIPFVPNGRQAPGWPEPRRCRIPGWPTGSLPLPFPLAWRRGMTGQLYLLDEGSFLWTGQRY